MADNNWIQAVVARVVSQVLESQIPGLRDQLVQRVLEELQPNLAGHSPAGPKKLLQAITGIRQATAQKEILATLLDGASQFCSRTALFVVRGESVMGWQARGFGHNDDIKNFPLGVSSGIGARVLQEKAAMSAKADALGPRFTASFAPPADDRIFLFPLLLKEKVAALLYADSGVDPGGILDEAALEMLVMSGGLWLEIVALRRATAAMPAAQESGEPAAAPVEKAEAAVMEPVAAMQEAPAPVVVPAEMAMAAAASAGAASTITAPRPAPSGEDDAVHRKARRFAKLLVDEIKLYNQAKVLEGRKNRDLYQRLKEDIDKSRSAYEKRYGSSAAGGEHYFDQEIVRNLAENDSSLLGAGFPR